MIDSVLQNLRNASRSLRKTSAVSASIVLLLALGIGANATMFRIVDRLLLSPPHHLVDPDHLRFVYTQRPTLTMFPANMTYSDVQDIKHLPAFEAVAAYTDPQRWTLGAGTEARKVRLQRAEAAYFSMLGVRPVLGRFYSSTEDEPDAPLTAVISENFWEREFARDPHVLGRVLSIEKNKYQVIGVAPAGFTGVGLSVIDIWLPLRAATAAENDRKALETRTWWWAHAVVRLRPDATDAAAGAQMTLAHITARRAAEAAGSEPYLSKGPPPRLYTTPIIAARGPNPSKQSSIAMWLAGVSAIVLLIACANVANLLLTRGILAQRELAVRAALGAARGRLVAQVLTEAALLAGTGAILAFVIAKFAARVAYSFLPDIDFSLDDAGIGAIANARLLLFNIAAAGVTVLLAGVLPAMQASRTSAMDALRAVSRGSSATRSPMRSALMIGQTMLSVVLLVGAGLFVRSLYSAGGTDVGFDYKHLITITLEQNSGLTPQRRDQLYLDAFARVSQLSGVRRASLAMQNTIAFGGWSGPGGIKVEGHPVIDDLPDGGPFLYSGTEGFFDTLGVAVTRGRGFQPNEYVEGAEPVGMISETFARTVWPNADPIGQCFEMHAKIPMAMRNKPGAPPPESCRRIVGVFRDFARQTIGDSGTIAIAIPGRANGRKTIDAMVVQSEGDPSEVLPAIRQAVLSVSPDVRFAQINAMTTRFDELLEPWRLGATMFAAFGVLALVVAAVGLYSLLAFGVAQRTRELGIRAALGATRGDLMHTVLIRAARFLASGLALGAIIAAIAARYMENLLFGVKATDPAVYAMVIVTLVAAGALATLIPAWRATLVSPTTALRGE
jgi:putative ABC transport system permease protein